MAAQGPSPATEMPKSVASPARPVAQPWPTARNFQPPPRRYSSPVTNAVSSAAVIANVGELGPGRQVGDRQPQPGHLTERAAVGRRGQRDPVDGGRQLGQVDLDDVVAAPAGRLAGVAHRSGDVLRLVVEDEVVVGGHPSGRPAAAAPTRRRRGRRPGVQPASPAPQRPRRRCWHPSYSHRITACEVSAFGHRVVMGGSCQRQRRHDACKHAPDAAFRLPRRRRPGAAVPARARGRSTSRADRSVLAVALGATLYSPATRPKLADDIARRAGEGATSMVVCLEDSIPDHALLEGERNAVAQLRHYATPGRTARWSSCGCATPTRSR